MSAENVIAQYEDLSLEEIISILKKADDEYTNTGESELEDNQYDALKLYAQRIDPANPYFTGVGSAVRGGKVKLPYQMGSLDQVYQGEFEQWKTKHNIHEELLVITDKLDGISALVIYDQTGSFQIAYSRGDGVEGADISRHVSKLHNVPNKIATTDRLVIRGEIICSPLKFKIIKDKILSRGKKAYKNPRNMVAGLMNSSTNPDVVYETLDFVAYEIVGSELNKTKQLDLLEDLQFKVVRANYKTAKNINEEMLTELLNYSRKTSEYELDGVVIEVNEATARKRINPTKDTLNPAYAVKFKVADGSNFAVATVKEVQWRVSKDGYLKPRVKIHPIDLVGVTIQHATGFNAKFILENKIGPGAKIQITRSGDVIPFILGVVQPANEAQMPSEEAVWTKTGVDLVLKNVQENDTVKLEQLVDFFMSIGVDHLGEGNLQKLYVAGFTTPEKIITMDILDIVMVLGNAIGDKVYRAMQEKLTNIPMYVLMGSSPIFGRGVGVRKMKKLYEAFDGDMSKCEDFNAIVAVDGFEEKTAKKIVEAVPAFNAFLKQVEGHITVASYKPKPKGGLTGQKIVFTGFRDSSLEAQIEAAGGEMQSGVSGKTTILVAADPNSNSTKLQKAREKGVRVIGVDELKQML